MTAASVPLVPSYIDHSVSNKLVHKKKQFRYFVLLQSRFSRRLRPIVDKQRAYSTPTVRTLESCVGYYRTVGKSEGTARYFNSSIYYIVTDGLVYIQDPNSTSQQASCTSANV